MTNNIARKSLIRQLSIKTNVKASKLIRCAHYDVLRSHLHSQQVQQVQQQYQEPQKRSFSIPSNIGGGNTFNFAKPGEHLKAYGIDLTQMAKENKLDPVIGRHDEIRRTLQILARRTKNNPVLIGEPGVGKV